MTGTPSTSDSVSAQAGLNMEPLPVENDEGEAWKGRNTQDKQGAEDAEPRFDDITIRFMDDEHETMRETDVKKSLGKKRGGWRMQG